VKPATLLLIASLAANVALAALLVVQRTNSRIAVPAASTAMGKPAARAALDAEALRAALASGNLAALEAAGLPADVARHALIGQAFLRYQRANQAATGAGADAKWWRGRSRDAGRTTSEQLLAARRELSEALVAAFGEDFGIGGADDAQLAFLSPEKRTALRRITQDYQEMMNKFLAAGGVQLASDKEKLRLLRAERDRDIAALLTPEERLAYEMRTSASASTVRARYGDAIENEAEFRRIYELQRAFDEKFPREALTGRISPDVLRARSDAERQLEDDIRTAVGDDRYTALRRAADPDVRNIDSLVSRLNLASTTADNVLSARERFAAESQRISSDPSIPPQQRRAQIQDLAARARSELTNALGAEAADAYAAQSPWMNMMQSGMAYSTTPRSGTSGLFGGNQSVYPVPPAGTMTGNAEHRVIVNAPATVDGAAGGDAFVGAPGKGVQVMTFSSSFTPADAAPNAGSTGNVKRDAAPSPTPAPGQAQPKP
jgi:hypothetical protein